MNDPVRAWAYAVVFGTAWGAAEATAGVALRAARVPLSGLALAAAGLLCLVTAVRLRPGPGIAAGTALVAAALKISVLGGVYPGPVLAVLLEGVLTEAAFAAAGNRPFAAAVAGAAVFASAPLQTAVTVRLVAGEAAFEALAGAARRLPGLGGAGVSGLVAGAAAAAAVVGAAVGLAAWRIAGRVLRRLGRSA